MIKQSKVDLLFQTRGEFSKNSADFLENNHERKLLLPPNRDWTKEYYAYRKKTLEFQEIIKFKIENLKGKKINPERFDQELANIYKYSKGMNKVMTDFY